MPSATLQPSELLHYLPTYRVLICKECRYAIQPSAISRHLKSIHHIYRTDRKAFMEYASKLDLADSGDVSPPEPHEAPVPLIPTENGLACMASECHHLCITAKRMKSHWATSHKDVVFDTAQWRPVYLQTFFRGNQLKYFAVCVSPPTSVQLQRNPDLVSNNSSLEIDKIKSALPCDAEWSVEDLELLQHFKASTYLDLAYSSVTSQLWQTEIPKLALEHSFLMHGILACAALHLAHLNPSAKKKYNFASARHQNEALPAFRLAIANPSEQNCNPLLAFSQLLMIHSFASEEQDEYLLLVGGSQESGMPDWLNIVRGSCAIFRDVWPAVMSGPFRALLIETAAENPLPDEAGNEEQIRRLGLLLHMPFCDLDSLEARKKRAAFGSALLELSRAFRKADAAKPSFSMWTAAYIWPARVSQDYLDLLAERNPAALILLAHYCILLEPLESRWYMSSIRRRLLSRIYRQLDENWRQWLQWPLDGIGPPVSPV